MSSKHLSLATAATLLLACQATTTKPDPTGSSAPKMEVLPVAWPKKDQIDSAALAALSTDAQRKVKESTVPVLVPRDPKLLAVGTVSVPIIKQMKSARPTPALRKLMRDGD